MTDISNRTPLVPQSYSKSGIISKNNINSLGRSINDIECRNGMRIDRNPVGGHIFYPPDNMYHYKLYDPVDIDPDVEEDLATIKMNWGSWTRSSKYTYSRNTLQTDIASGITGISNGSSLSYKTVELASNCLSKVYIQLVPSLTESDGAQYLEPFNKPWRLVTNVRSSAFVANYSEIFSEFSASQEDLKNTEMLIGLVNTDENGHITWTEQCYQGGDIDDVASFYEGPWKIEIAGKGYNTPANAASTSLTTPMYNTNNSSTGNPNHHYFPYGLPYPNQIIVTNPCFQKQGSIDHNVWSAPTFRWHVLDLSDERYKSNSVSITTIIRVRDARYEEQVDSDVDLGSYMYDVSSSSPVATASGEDTYRHTDSFMFSQKIGECKLDKNNYIIKTIQHQHGSIVVPIYDGDFSTYYTDPDETVDKIRIKGGLVQGPMDNYIVSSDSADPTYSAAEFNNCGGSYIHSLVDPSTEVPEGFSKSKYYKYLICLEVALDAETGEIDKTSIGYENFTGYRQTNGEHWCDFVEEFGYQKIPIGEAVYAWDTTTSKWELFDWIQLQYGPITLHHHCICDPDSSSDDASLHYVGIQTTCYDGSVCPTTTTTTTACPET